MFVEYQCDVLTFWKRRVPVGPDPTTGARWHSEPAANTLAKKVKHQIEDLSLETRMSKIEDCFSQRLRHKS